MIGSKDESQCERRAWFYLDYMIKGEAPMEADLFEKLKQSLPPWFKNLEKRMEFFKHKRELLQSLNYEERFNRDKRRRMGIWDQCIEGFRHIDQTDNKEVIIKDEYTEQVSAQKILPQDLVMKNPEHEVVKQRDKTEYFKIERIIKEKALCPNVS